MVFEIKCLITYTCVSVTIMDGVEGLVGPVCVFCHNNSIPVSGDDHIISMYWFAVKLSTIFQAATNFDVPPWFLSMANSVFDLGISVPFFLNQIDIPLLTLFNCCNCAENWIL